jgi:rare lipoprotein A
VSGNGKSVVVRVTDRGPFHADRVIDLSYAAAYRLGYVDNGSTLVEVESILPEGATTMSYAQVMPAPRSARQRSAARRSATRLNCWRQSSGSTGGSAPSLVAEATLPASPPRRQARRSRGGGVFLQLGAFASADNAESCVHTCSANWTGSTRESRSTAGGGMHRVHLGPYPSRADAEKVAERIRLALGYKPTFVAR